MNHAWRTIAQRLVRSLLIVEPQPAADALTRFGHRSIRFDVHLLILAFRNSGGEAKSLEDSI
jgi:hypothetical protein